MAGGHLPAGRFYAEWEEQAPVTREGQLMFSFQFLHVGGRWGELLRRCPLHYTGNRGSGAANVMSGVGRQVQSGGQRTVKVSILHERSDLIAHAGTLISKELQEIRVITERWSAKQRWTLLLTRVLRRWLGGKWLPDLPDDAKLLLSG